MTQDMICIICPKGCHLKVTNQDGQVSCTGNACKRGAIYATQEMIAPTRMLTSTVAITDALHARCPVISSQAVPKDRLFEMVKVLETITVQAPVKLNQVIVSNILDSGIDILASRSFEIYK